MKSMIRILLFSLVTPYTVFAVTGRVRYQCANAEDTSVVLHEITQGVYRADVTVQSVGDAYPTFHFSNIEEQNGIEDPAHGTPIKFAGPGFELTIKASFPGHPAVLKVPSLGLRNEKLNCN